MEVHTWGHKVLWETASVFAYLAAMQTAGNTASKRAAAKPPKTPPSVSGHNSRAPGQQRMPLAAISCRDHPCKPSGGGK
jgi:hypothetical protein